MEYKVFVFITIFIIFFILGLISNRTSFSSPKESKIFLIILLSYFIIMLSLDKRMERNFAIVIFGGFLIGFITKAILKKKKR